MQTATRRCQAFGAPLGSPAIVARGLTKRFGRVTAVDDLSFEVLPGRVTGFLGPNGAGKSTTLRMLLGLVRARRREPPRCSGLPYASLDRPAQDGGRGAGGPELPPAPQRAGTTCGCSPPRRGSPTRGSTRCWTRWGSADAARPQGGRLLARHAATARPGRARCSGDPSVLDPGRARERAGPARDPLAPRDAPRVRRPRQRRAGLEPPARARWGRWPTT